MLVAFSHLHLSPSDPSHQCLPLPLALILVHVTRDYISMPVFFKGYGLSEVQAVRARTR